MFDFNLESNGFKNINAEEFFSLRNEKEAFVLDVRTEDEQTEGVIPGYTMINVMCVEFSEQVNELDKSKIYLIYCRSGARSKLACATMARMGFENLYNLRGGIIAWNNTYDNKKN